MQDVAFENLANAIICQAADDYMEAMKSAIKNSEKALKYQDVIFTDKFRDIPLIKGDKINTIRKYLAVLLKTEAAVKTMTECRDFFHSEWYHALTSADPDFILCQIEMKVNNESR